MTDTTQKRKTRRRSPKKPLINLTPTVLRFGQYLAVIVLAGIAIIRGIDNPEVWAFLGGALALLFGQK